MKNGLIFLILITLVACGPSDEPQNAANVTSQDAVDQAVAESREILEQAKTGNKPEANTDDLEGCAVFEDSLVPEIFAADPSLVSYTRSIPVRSAGHLVCLSSWDKPNKAELDKAYVQAIMEWTKNNARGDKKPQPKPASGTNEVSLTLVADSFSSTDEAMASLDSAVATLSKGISFKVGGKTHETKMSFGDWLDGVGDKAIFSDKGELMVVSGSRRFSVHVSVLEDDAQNREKAVELAQRLIDSF